MAPLWADCNYCHSESVVHYQQYDELGEFGSADAEKTRRMLDRASADALELGGFAGFQATWVLVVTWVRMYPAGWIYPGETVGGKNSHLIRMLLRLHMHCHVLQLTIIFYSM